MRPILHRPACNECHSVAFKTTVAWGFSCVSPCSVVLGMTTWKWGWCSSHKVSHAARQNIYALNTRYASVTWRSFLFLEAINTDLAVPLILECKWFCVNAMDCLGSDSAPCHLLEMIIMAPAAEMTVSTITHAFCYTHQSSHAVQMLEGEWIFHFGVQSQVTKIYTYTWFSQAQQVHKRSHKDFVSSFSPGDQFTILWLHSWWCGGYSHNL